MHALDVRDVSKSYGNNPVLSHVNLAIEDGEFYALMGPNGSGKTTLISVIASVCAPSKGAVTVYGRRNAKEVISYVPQDNFSSPRLTGRENLMYFAQLYGFSRRKASSLAVSILEKIRLSAVAQAQVSTYSGGMRKRLEVGTGLFPGTKLLLLDEPTTGLDPSARREFLGMIKEMNENGMTIFFITHIGEDAELASRVGFIDEGVIIAEGTPDTLKKRSGLTNVLTVETAVKSRKIHDVLKKFSDQEKVLETEAGYRIYCESPQEVLPNVVRALDSVGCTHHKIDIDAPSLEDVFFALTEKQVVL
ncbi:MAG: ABC transporter ATP-binding protein [Theionarchaea archaeon]|nr:ABC transporter ATP-binding protein [Theionarchaea archaeon]MBU7022033.1 ABC transporter ATP-binding protein [Theionarchaea archaeon]